MDRLQAALEAAGVRVWRDTAHLWPGEDWREEIRQAITSHAMVFVACFSTSSLVRARSFQSEELALAVEELRQRRPDAPWLIPVRLDDCQIPDLPIGGGRTLAQLQHADVFGERQEQETTRLVAAIRQIMRSPSEQDHSTTPRAVNVMEVVITPIDDRISSQVTVARSPAGMASAVVQIDVEALLAGQAELQDAVLTSAVDTHLAPKNVERSVRAVGQALFIALFGAGDVANVYRASVAMAAARGHDLCVLLRIEDPALRHLPWEVMYDTVTGTYLIQRDHLIRHVPVASPEAPLVVDPPLRILGVISAPRGLSALNAGKEMDLIARALSDLHRRRIVQVHWAPKATWASLRELLQRDQWHVVHFIGHSVYDPERGEPSLALTRDDGQPHLVQASRIVDLFRTRPMPRLVMLNACASADVSAMNFFAGAADALIRGGVNAVVAMQYEISDRAAVTFSREFYGAIAHGQGVSDAVSRGRRAVMAASSKTLEWAAPVLYLRGEDSRLFTFPESVHHKAADKGFDSGKELERTDQPTEVSFPQDSPRPATGVAVVVCALEAEYLAMRAFLSNLRQLAHPSGTQFEVGNLTGAPWQVALAVTGLRPASAGIVADRAISLFGPDVLLSVGIAGALKSDIALGDVVVATRVDTYQPRRAFEDSRLRLLSWDAPYGLEQAARRLVATDGWQHWLSSDMADSLPTVHFVPIVADEVVMDGSPTLFDLLKLRYADAAVIEMEGVGIAHAARVNAMPALVIRGISDYGDSKADEWKRSAEWHRRASAVAAAFAAALLGSFEIQPRPVSADLGNLNPIQATASKVGDAVRLVAERPVQHLAELDSESMTDLLVVLGDIQRWRMPGSRWDRVSRILNALEDALRTNNGEAVRSSIAELELSSPVRVTRIGSSADVPVPDRIRTDLAEMIRSVRAKIAGTADETR